MAFTEDMVSRLIADPITLARGSAYYSAGRVKDLSVSKRGSTALVSAVVRGPQEHRVSCSVNRSGTYMYGVSCTCPDFDPEGGYCMHVAATLLAYANDKPTQQVQATSAAGEKLLQAFRPTVQPQYDESGDMRLVPIVGFGPDHITLALTIGQKQLHLVPSIANLCQQVKDGETVSYGKRLSFRHTLSAFEPRSRQLMELIMEIIDVRAFHIQRELLSASTITDERQVALPPEALDDFFELFLGETLKTPTENIRLTLDAPNLAFSIAASEGGITLQVPAYRTYSGSKYRYLHANGGFFRLDPELAERLAVLQDQSSQGGLFFDTVDIPAFCNFVLPVLQQSGTVSDPDNALADYTPETPEIKIMLDSPAGNCLSATVSFCYDAVETDAFDQTQPQPFRNLRQEALAVNLVKSWLPEVDPAQRTYTLNGTDEQIYNFLVDGLSQLADTGTLLCTDRFEGIHHARPRVSVGVSLSSGLLEISVQSPEFPVEELEAILASCRLKKRYHRLKNGLFLELDNDALKGLRELDETIGLSAGDIQNGVIRLPGFRAMEVDQAFSDDRSAAFTRSGSFREMIRDFRSAEQNEFPLPEEMAPILRSYQRAGFRWLKTLEEYGFGGILADDMGLGKTVQMITFLLSAKARGLSHPALIVCPASLVLNWLDECSRFAPALNVMAVSGNSIYRRFQLNEAENYDVLITSYDTLKRDIDQYELMNFSYCILDEAQYIKNHNTKSCQAARRIRAECRFALTGTPVENRLSELWSVFDFLMPGYLSTYARFRDRFEIPIVKNGDKAAEERLGRLIAPFVLRRLKKDVLTELPPKTETVQYAIMSGSQRKLYEANVYETRRQLENATEGDRMQILAALTRLRQICCDPRLCVQDAEQESAKLELCMQLVNDAVQSGHQLLLFSQFTTMLDLIEQELKKEDISYFVLEGSTSKPRRAELVKRFNAGEASVFLISLKAGGTGLNLTAADIVIHYDPWWNLAAQNQATDRTHRIGQQNPVQVYQLIIKDSIEERILNLQKEKGALAESIIAFGTGGITTMSKDDLLSLLADT